MSSSDRLWVIRGLDDGCGCRLESGGGISIVDLFLLSGRGRNFYQVVEVIINNYLPIPVCPYVASEGRDCLLFFGLNRYHPRCDGPTAHGPPIWYVQSVLAWVRSCIRSCIARRQVFNMKLTTHSTHKLKHNKNIN